MQTKVKIFAVILLCLVGILSGCGTKETKVDSTTKNQSASTSKSKDNSSEKGQSQNNKSKTSPKFFGNLGTKLPFQGGTFDSENAIDPENLNITPRVGSVADYDVIEKDGKTEVIWAAYADEATNSEDSSTISVYRSFSNKNGWNKSEKLGKFKLENKDVQTYIIGNNLYLVYKDVPNEKNIITQVIFDNSGKIQSQNKIESKPSEYVELGSTDKGRAISIGNKIYTSDNAEAPIEVQDKYDLFNANESFYLNEKTSKLYVKNSDLGLIQMDVKTGEPLYNSDGKEATYGSKGVVGTAEEALLGGFGDVAIYDKFESTTTSASENITAVEGKSKQMVEGATFNLPVDGTDNSAQYMSSVRVTETKDEVHFWRLVEFEHKVVLKEIISGKEFGQPMDND